MRLRYWREDSAARGRLASRGRSLRSNFNVDVCRWRPDWIACRKRVLESLIEPVVEVFSSGGAALPIVDHWDNDGLPAVLGEGNFVPVVSEVAEHDRGLSCLGSRLGD